jgi:hypothetical protein
LAAGRSTPDSGHHLLRQAVLPESQQQKRSPELLKKMVMGMIDGELHYPEPSHDFFRSSVFFSRS